MGQHHSFFSQSSTWAQILVLQQWLLQQLFYKATISNPYRCVFQHVLSAACGNLRISAKVLSSANWKLFLSCCFPTLLNWNIRESKSLLIIRAPPELLLSEAPKLISRLRLWTFLISVMLTASFWKRNGSQGRLMKGQIFWADLLTKMTGPSILLYFKWLMPNGALIESIGLHRNTTPRFQGSILNLPPRAAAALTPWPRIGETRTIGSALLWVPLCLMLELSHRALVTALWLTTVAFG